jgi:hypothetical protein
MPIPPDKPVRDITPAEIAQRVREVQASWSAVERERRLAWRSDHWIAPLCEDPAFQDAPGRTRTALDDI